MTESLHGSMLAYAGAGCLLLGPSGSGKSRLLSETMALGAKMIADDRVVLSEQSGMPMGAAPPETAGILELRGFGLIRVTDYTPRHVLHLVIELDINATERLPEREKRRYLGHELPFLRVPAVPTTSGAVLLQYIKAMQEGRILPPDWHAKG